jgi:hypothetical protein
MMLAQLALTFGWIFINPVRLPDGWRLFTLLPLAACVALVYRGSRARTVRELPRPTLITFFNIVIGMFLIALAFYVVHMLVLRFA